MQGAQGSVGSSGGQGGDYKLPTIQSRGGRADSRGPQGNGLGGITHVPKYGGPSIGSGSGSILGAAGGAALGGGGYSIPSQSVPPVGGGGLGYKYNAGSGIGGQIGTLA